MFTSLRRKRFGLMRALLLPLLCIVGAHIYRMIYSLNYAGDREEYAYVLSISSIVMQILWPLLAVSCHRVLLEDSKEPRMVDGIWPGWRQIKYSLVAIVVALPIVAYWIVDTVISVSLAEDLSTIAVVGIKWAIFVPALYLSSRISLTLPAVALQRPLSFSQSWILTRGNGWRITAILSVAPAFYEFFNLFYVPRWQIGSALDVVEIVISLAIGIISIGALSVCYQHLVKEQQPGSQIQKTVQEFSESRCSDRE